MVEFYRNDDGEYEMNIRVHLDGHETVETLNTAYFVGLSAASDVLWESKDEKK